jgi:hypothetical protein
MKDETQTPKGPLEREVRRLQHPTFSALDKMAFIADCDDTDLMKDTRIAKLKLRVDFMWNVSIDQERHINVLLGALRSIAKGCGNADEVAQRAIDWKIDA